MKNLWIVLSLIFSVSCASHKPAEPPPPPAPIAKPLPKTLDEAVNSDFRTEKNKARDTYRHPLATLQFFEVQPDQTVIEISPAGGWYTEILAPLLATKGQYVGTVKKADLSDKMNADLKAWVDKNPEASSKAKFVEFGGDNWKLGDDGSADRVLTFRNVHNWMIAKKEKDYFKAFYAVLKPGGILGVVEHRAGKKTKSKNGDKGYVQEKYIIDLAKKAGFKLMAKSEINANPKDTKDYPEGVWTLPPTLRLGDKDRDKYLAIGESDRMTLKFIKPVKK